MFSSRFPSAGGAIDEIIGDGTSTPRLPSGGTIGIGDIADSGLSFITILRALGGDAETNLLSTPSIVTLDNQEAEIIVGQNVPFVTGESTSSSSDTTNPFRTIEREDIGISLKVKPQINEGNAITLEIEQEVSQIEGSTADTVDIVTSKRSIRTTVQLEDAEMLVLGGLIDDTTIDSEQKIPFLGDIPGLGWLFRATRSEKAKRNLLSQNKYNFMRDLQLEGLTLTDDAVGPLLVPYE